MTSILDLVAFRARLNPPAETPPQDPFETPPWVTITMHDGEGGPVRLTAHDMTPTRLRDAARRLIAMAVALFNRAYAADADNNELPRMIVTLYHSGKIETQALNGSGEDGKFTDADWRFVRGAVPHIPSSIDAARAAQDEQP